jgi:hypothetical protein
VDKSVYYGSVLGKQLVIPIEIHRNLKALAVHHGIFLKELVVQILRLGIIEFKRAERERVNAASR